MPAPRVRPFVCATCRRGGTDAGPFYESSFHYPDPVTGAALRHYTCRQCAHNVFFGQDSPFAAVVFEAQTARTDAETERDLADAAARELREALEAANQQIARLEGSSRGVQLDPQDLAGKLAAALESRWGTPPASWRDRTGSRA